MTPARALRVGCLGEKLIMQRSHLHTTPRPFTHTLNMIVGPCVCVRALDLVYNSVCLRVWVWESSNQSWPVSDGHCTTFKLPDFDSNRCISSKYFFKPVGHGSGISHPVYNENSVDKITHVRRDVTLILSMIHTAQPVLLTRPINNKDVCTHECFFTHSALGTEACAHVWIFMNVCILLARRLSQKVWLKMTLSHLTKLEDM